MGQLPERRPRNNADGSSRIALCRVTNGWRRRTDLENTADARGREEERANVMDGLEVEVLGPATGGPVQAESVVNRTSAVPMPQRVLPVPISRGYLGAGLSSMRVSSETT